MQINEKIEKFLKYFNEINKYELYEIKKTRGDINKIQQTRSYFVLKNEFSHSKDNKSDNNLRLATMIFLAINCKNSDVTFGAKFRNVIKNNSDDSDSSESLLKRILNKNSEELLLENLYRIVKRLESFNLKDFFTNLYFLEKSGNKNILEQYYIKKEI
jgi:hypothetical protein